MGIINYNEWESNKLRGYSDSEKKEIIAILDRQILSVKPISEKIKNMILAIKIFRRKMNG